MATQNHTATFLSLRENYQRRNKLKKPKSSAVAVNPLTEGLGGEGEDIESLLRGPKYTLPPVWVDSKDACESIVIWLEDSMVRLDEAHKNRLMVRFDEESEGETDREIDALTRTITKKFKEAEVKLRDIGKIDNSISDDEVSVRKNVQRSVANRLQQLSLRFRKLQKEYMIHLGVQKQYSGFDGSNGGGGAGDEMNTSSSSAFLLSQEEEQENLSQRIHERDAEIGRIAKSIEDLALIFKELAVLVIEQGTILDRIDFNMDLVVDRTQKGVLELEKAEKYQKSNRAPWCIFILVVLIVFFFAILVAKLR